MSTKMRADQLDSGTGANQVVKLDGSSKLPAVDGSQLTGVGGGGLFSEDSDNNIVGGTGAGASLVGAATLNNFLAGVNAGNALSSGDDNVFVGHSAGIIATSASDNVAIGSYAGDAITIANNCTLVGKYAGSKIVDGSGNTCIGSDAGGEMVGGHQNILIGQNAGRAIVEGDDNTAVGFGAGFQITSGVKNVCVGINAGPTANQSNKLFIDTVKSDTPLIGGDFSTNIVTINGDLEVTGNVISHIAINAQVGTLYELVLADDGILVTMNNASANTLRIPTDTDVAFPIGTQILVEQEGAGTTTIESAGIGSPAGGSPPGVAIHSTNGLRSTASQYSTLTLIKKATNTWLIAGDLA